MSRFLSIIFVTLLFSVAAQSQVRIPIPPDFFKFHFQTDKTEYVVGESPVYEITNGIPFGIIRWSSYIYDPVQNNFVNTGEFNAFYGDIISGDDWTTGQRTRYFHGVGNPFTCDDVGIWVKEVHVLDFHSPNVNEMVKFTVQPNSSCVGSTP